MLKLRDIMTRDVFTLSSTIDASRAAWELSVRGYTGAPVQDARGRLVGVLSRSDLMDPERTEGSLEGKAVQDLMTPAMFTLYPEAPVSSAIGLMVREGIHRVIVMDDDRQMVGIVTSSDILHSLVSGELVDATLPSAFSTMGSFGEPARA
jgi:CBS-domain-containing membrane protein